MTPEEQEQARKEAHERFRRQQAKGIFASWGRQTTATEDQPEKKKSNDHG